MTLSDVMSGSGLAGYAEAGLVLFLLTFVAIALRTLSKSNTEEWDRARQLPLSDDSIAVEPASSSRGERT